MIISPAKKMNFDTDSLPWEELPLFLDRTQLLCEKLCSMSYAELKKLWKCNDKIAQQNFERIRNMDLNRRLTPAILAYEGIQYKYMSPAVFDEQSYAYLDNHLYILSGFYGALRPFDGVTPYRLEMQTRFHRKDLDSLYDFWGESIANQVFAGCSGMVNLASKEYSKCVTKYLPKDIPCVTCVFGELIDGKLKEKGTYAKMARGSMVRFMAEKKIEQLEELKNFDEQGYHFAAEWSDEENYVFLR